MTQGLDNGLGNITSLNLYLSSAGASGQYGELHAFVACAMFWPAAKRTDSAYTWYKVHACCNGHTQKTIDECSASAPKEIIQPIRACMKRPEAASLVAAMHTIGESVRDFPTVLVEGQPDPRVPEPDTHGDDPKALIKEVCRRASAAGADDLPAACS